METTPQKSKFSVQILSQEWLGDEPQQFDLCSHGQIRLMIGGELILDGRASFGLSESALALLRTLERDHNAEQPLAEKLIFHGCGKVLMQGCPIGVDWEVLHQGDQVVLRKIRRWDWPDENRPTLFPQLEITVPHAEYRQAILAFANEVRQFFKGEEKVFFDDQDRQSYLLFWQEFDRLIAS